MSLRTRLTVFVLLFGSTVLANIFALFYLVRSISASMEAIEHIRQRQLVVVQMNAHLRDAEAALYRYQINGEAGFKDQFATQLNNFAQDLEQYHQLAAEPKELTWVSTLEGAYQQARSTGDKLINLRDQQVESLQEFVSAQTQMTGLLLSDAKPLLPEDATYQTSVSVMQDSSRAMLSSVTDYLASPDETKRVQFTDAVVNFHQGAENYGLLVKTADEKKLVDDINGLYSQMQTLGSQLISEKDLQQSLFANFFAIIFNAGQQTIVGQIEPHETDKFNQEQAALLQAVNTAILVSILTAVVISIIAILFMFRLTRQVNHRVDALLQGAERVTEGNLAQPVQINGSDEFGVLSNSFNNMMRELANREERLRALIEKMAQIQDEERRLIGLDLHDGLTQLIISANMHLNTLNALIGSQLEPEATQELDVSRTMVKRSIEEARKVIAELRPTLVDDFGLEEGLRRYVNEVCESQRWECDLAIHTTGLDFPPAVSAAVFRIAQEALTNTRKHAQTSKIRVVLGVDHENLHLSLQDWGLGFDIPPSTDDSAHLGLVSMRERAELLGGQFYIHSKPGEGTLVEVSIPLTALAERNQNVTE